MTICREAPLSQTFRWVPLSTSVYFRMGTAPLKSKKTSEKKHAENPGTIIGGKLAGEQWTNVRIEPKAGIQIIF